MGLAELVRLGVGLAHQITLGAGPEDGLQCEIPHHAWTGYTDAHGTSSYADPVTRTGLFTQKNRQIERDGRLIQTRAVITFLEPFAANGASGRSEPIDPRDVFDLPDGSKGQIVDVEGLTDPSTSLPYFCRVWFGSGTGAR